MINMSFKIHNHLIQYFVAESLKNKSINQGHKETLAIITGHEKNGVITSHDLIFPKQSATTSSVDDLGMFLQ